MEQPYTVYWGDTHHNTYQHYVQDPPLDEILRWASTYLDFYTGAYYTPAFVLAPYTGDAGLLTGSVSGGHLSEQVPADTAGWRGVHLEGWKVLLA